MYRDQSLEGKVRKTWALSSDASEMTAGSMLVAGVTKKMRCKSESRPLGRFTSQFTDFNLPLCTSLHISSQPLVTCLPVLNGSTKTLHDWVSCTNPGGLSEGLQRHSRPAIWWKEIEPANRYALLVFLAKPFHIISYTESNVRVPLYLLFNINNTISKTFWSIIEVHHKTLLIMPMIIIVLRSNTTIALTQAASAGRRAECTTPSPKGVAISMT